jgi:hypothetical protein
LPRQGETGVLRWFLVLLEMLEGVVRRFVLEWETPQQVGMPPVSRLETRPLSWRYLDWMRRQVFLRLRQWVMNYNQRLPSANR